MSGHGERALAPNLGGRRVRLLLGALAAVYLGGVWLTAAGSALPERLLPRPARYFTQIACLFPRAAEAVIDYRAEGLDCASGRFREIDVRPLFPIHADDEESRFHRAMFFYRRDRKTLEALDEYLTSGHNARAPGAAPIGGVLLLSLRIPLPDAGGPIERYQRKPLSDHPPAIKNYWYRTPRELAQRRCQARAAAKAAP